VVVKSFIKFGPAANTLAYLASVMEMKTVTWLDSCWKVGSVRANWATDEAILLR